MQFIGFVVLLIGVLLYNEILIISAFGLDCHTKVKLLVLRTEEDSDGELEWE